MKTYTLNGIRDSARETDRMAAALASLGREVKTLRYVPVHSWDAWKPGFRMRVAEVLINQIDKGGDIVAWSMGCLLVHDMLRFWKEATGEAFGPLFRRMVFFAPAMNRSGWDWEDYAFENLLVVHHRRDAAIRLGKLLPLHPFGTAGQKGFRTTDSRIAHLECLAPKPSHLGHGHYFHPPHLEKWARKVDLFLRLPAISQTEGKPLVAISLH